AAHTEYLHTTTPLVSLDYPRVPPDLPSFPPRRSSDLRRALGDRRATHVARLSCAPVHEPHDPGARVEPVPHGPLHEPARREEQALEVLDVADRGPRVEPLREQRLRGVDRPDARDEVLV